MKVKATQGRTDIMGGTYYFTPDGKRAYGNQERDGYVTEIKEETYDQPAKPKSTTPAAPPPPAKLGLLGTIAGVAAGYGLMKVLLKIGPTLLKIIGALLGLLVLGLMGYSLVLPWIQRVGTNADMASAGSMNLEGVLSIAAMIGVICVFIFFSILTFRKRKLYIWQSLLAFFLLFIPTSLVHMGGFSAFVEHGGEAVIAIILLPLMTSGPLLTIPTVLLFLMWFIPRKIRQKRGTA